jgi:glutamyl-tRNA synthetase
MSVITRFAPSPTGYLHIGGARTALFNYLFSRHHGGKFLLRIEDTDEKRSTSEAIDAILQGLDWLGLKHDDNFILQSKNLVRHKEIAEKLLEKNQAYLCYTSAEELEEMRDFAEKKGEVFRFKSSWRDKINSQNSSVKPTIRIKAPLEGETVIRDLVQGEIRVKNSELDDLVMLRGDGSPTYMLAVVVDDHDMEISHVIRGDDHLTNAFRQKIIFDAMGWKVPEFAHIPLIHGPDGAKMSKRHGATSVIDYKEMGYLPEALRNYLLRLGWSHGDAEIISDAQAIEWFTLDKVGKSPARFDFIKLNSINKYYVNQKSDVELFELLFEKSGRWSGSAEFSVFQPLSSEEKNRILKAINFCKISASMLDELAARVMIYRDGFVENFDVEAQKILTEKKSLILDLQKVFSDLSDWTHDGIKNSLNEFAAAKNLKIKDFGPVLRIILTFSAASPGGIFDVIEILGKAEVLARIANCFSVSAS